MIRVQVGFLLLFLSLIMRILVMLLVVIGCAACSRGGIKSGADDLSVAHPGNDKTNKTEGVVTNAEVKTGTNSGNSNSDTKTGGTNPLAVNPSTNSGSSNAGLTNASAKDPSDVDPKGYEKCIRDIAAKMDNTVEDGWFFGEDPRMFKSFYRKIPPEQKAEFAMDYHKFMSGFKQDLVRDYNTFVPYSKRADFAMDWWAKRVPRFNSSELKMKVLWVHESIQDAGELWWRAGEKLGQAPSDSILIMAHDEEQRMVSHFCERGDSPGSISDQVWKREHSK